MSNFLLPSPEHKGGITPLPIRDIGRSGRLDIRFSARLGRTILDRQYHETPFKVSPAHYSPASSLARVIVMHSTAGLFGGDRLEARIHVEAGARAMVTSQSATKIHPSGAAPACQSLQLVVETGGELHYYVDPVIPFTDSRLYQETRIELTSGARFYYWDGLMAGRVRRGENWRFNELQSETSVFVDAELAYLDRFELRPSDRSPTRRWAMDRHRYMATSIAYDPSMDEEDLRAIHSDITSLDGTIASGLDVPFAQLMIGRFVAQNGASFRKARESYQRTIVKHLVGPI